MNAPALLTALAAAGIAALADDDALVLRPASRVPPGLLAECRRLKPALLALLRSEAANGNAIYSHIQRHTPPLPIAKSNPATSIAPAAPAAGLLALSEIAGLVASITGADPRDAPERLRHAIRSMLDAGHGRGETLQTLMPAVPLGCDPGALAIAIWDGETPPAGCEP